jgi:hypothetical protein
VPAVTCAAGPIGTVFASFGAVKAGALTTARLLREKQGVLLFPGGGREVATGFRRPGFRIPEFRIPGFRIPGFRIPGFRIPGFRIPGIRIPGFRIPGFRIPGFRFWRNI